MADFDPKAYIAKRGFDEEPSGFDPSAYIARRGFQTDRYNSEIRAPRSVAETLGLRTEPPPKSFYQNAAIGISQGMGNTITGAAELERNLLKKIPGPVGDYFDLGDQGTVRDVLPKEITTPQNPTQQAFFTGEQIGEFFLPSSGLAGLQRASRLGALKSGAGKGLLTLARKVKGGKPFRWLLNLGVRASTEAGTFAAIDSLQKGHMDDVDEAAMMGAMFTGGMEAVKLTAKGVKVGGKAMIHKILNPSAKILKKDGFKADWITKHKIYGNLNSMLLKTKNKIEAMYGELDQALLNSPANIDMRKIFATIEKRLFGDKKKIAKLAGEGEVENTRKAYQSYRNSVLKNVNGFRDPVTKKVRYTYEVDVLSPKTTKGTTDAFSKSIRQRPDVQQALTGQTPSPKVVTTRKPYTDVSRSTLGVDASSTVPRTRPEIRSGIHTSTSRPDLEMGADALYHPKSAEVDLSVAQAIKQGAGQNGSWYAKVGKEGQKVAENSTANRRVSNTTYDVLKKEIEKAGGSDIVKRLNTSMSELITIQKVLTDAIPKAKKLDLLGVMTGIMGTGYAGVGAITGDWYQPKLLIAMAIARGLKSPRLASWAMQSGGAVSKVSKGAVKSNLPIAKALKPLAKRAFGG